MERGDNEVRNAWEGHIKDFALVISVVQTNELRSLPRTRLLIKVEVFHMRIQYVQGGDEEGNAKVKNFFVPSSP